MIRLTGTNKLQVVLGGAATASRVTVSYMDFTTTATTGGTQLSATNGATPVDICDAPAASTTRQVDHISLVALAAMTATFSVHDGSARDLFKVTLALGDVFDWSHSGGAKVLDANGALKSTLAGVSIAAGKTFAVSNSLTLAGTDGTTMTFPTTSATIARTDAANTFSGLQTFSGGITLSGAASNIATGSNYISNGGTDAGLSFNSNNTALLTSSAGFIFGSTTSYATYGNDSQFQWHAAATESIATWASYRSIAQGPAIVIAKARGQVVGSPTAISTNDYLGSISYTGYVGSTGGWVLGAQMAVRESGTVADTATGLGAYYSFSATAVGSAMVEQLRVGPSTVTTFVPFSANYGLLRTVVTETGATRTVAATDTHIICNRAGTVTLTLPAAASFTGRELTVRTIQAQTAVSDASNVVPLEGGAAGTAILAATAGKWALLVSDGTNWQIQSAN